MLSSNFKSAPKSSRDADSDVLDEADGFQRGRLNSSPGEGRGRSTVIFSQKDGRGKPRGRPADFRSTRGDRRGSNIRSRGLYPGKIDREPFLKNQGNDLSISCYYDGDSKLIPNLPEDPRISKLLRRLCAETDIQKSAILCSKLQDAVMLPENMRYVRRSYDILAESLLDVLYSGPSIEAREQAASVLGRIGYVMGLDYNKHLDWLFTHYSSQQNDEIKILLLKSLNDTHLIDCENPILEDFASESMSKLQSVIESADTPKIFTSAVNAMITLSHTYFEHFAKYFVDMVDILVGWHVDGSQPKTIKEFALQTLAKLNKHWQSNIQFSVNLLSQFIEDLISDSADLSQSETSGEDIQRITSFINVFNTVAKSVGDILNPNISKTITWPFLTDSFEKVLNTFKKAVDVEFDEDLIIAGNECIFIFLNILQSKVSSNSTLLYKLIDYQMDNADILSDLELISLLNVIAKTIKEISSNLPIEFIQNIIGPKSNILQLRFTRSEHVLNSIIIVYHNFLNLKNIPLLQEAYKCVLGDLDIAYECFGHNFEVICRNNQFAGVTYELDEAENVILFHLQCLSDLANASNSIIGMWALQPSILELLAIKLNPHSEHLCRKYPAMQYAIIYLLYSHCRRNNHFIASSVLITNGQPRSNVCDILGISNLNLGEVSTSSPTSGHFSIILSLLKKLLDSVKTRETLLLTLRWIRDIFLQLEQYILSIYSTKQFNDLVVNLVHIGMSFSKQLIEIVADNLNILMNIRNVPWNPILLNKIALLSIIHIDSNDDNVSEKFQNLLVSLPWDIVHSQTSQMLFPKMENHKLMNSKFCLLNKVNMHKEYLMKTVNGQMSTQHFKGYMNYLLNSKGDRHILLNDAFINCWPLENSDLDNTLNTTFKLAGLNYSSIVSLWANWEAAQLCVSLKLRTPLGKPQETFMSIETAIKSLARELTQSDNKSGKSITIGDISAQQMRGRLLIEFMDCLEKAVYNAADGTAFVMMTVPKPVRTFFHTNWMTCREWLTRVRPAALAVSLHMSHASAAVRHAHALLSTNPTHSEVEVICLSLARALIKLQEPEALHGLYVWVKKNMNKKLPWLKAASEQASMRYEIAVENYKRLMNAKNNDNTGESSKPELDYRELHFVKDQLIDCQVHLQNWSDLAGAANLTNLSREYECLDKYDRNEMVYLEELSDWKVFDSKAQSSKMMMSYDTQVKHMELSLMYSAMQILYDRDNTDLSLLHDCSSVLSLMSKEFVRNQPYELMGEVNVLHSVSKALQKIIYMENVVNTLHSSVDGETLKKKDLNILSKILWWSQYFARVNSTENNLFRLESLRLDVIKAARKHGNIKWARKELDNYFCNNSQLQLLGSDGVTSMEDLITMLIATNNSYDLDIWSLNNSVALMETAKLLYGKEKSRSTAINLCASISLGVSQRLAMGENSYDLREKGTRMLVTLSKWMQYEDEKILISNLNSPLTKLVTALPEIGLVTNNVSENVISITDAAVGKLLQFSVNQCPGLAKAWSSFGSWCFRWGRKMVEYSSKTGEQLTDSDKLQIQNMMIGHNQVDFDTVCEILSKTRASCDDEDINWDEINTSEMIENQLRSIPSLSNAHHEHVSILVNIWRQAQKRVFSYYELSADAYFKFLQLSSESDTNQHSGDCAIVMATLRLLRLIVKHAMELQNVLESGLANTPTQPWKVIIPQLFSRLNHPEAYVRRCVSELLCRLAEDVPHLIIFSAVVGAVENKKIDLSDISFPKSFMNVENETEVADIADNSDTESDKGVENDLNCCFMDMVETLSIQAPETVYEVQILVQELQRINLLWDELWLGTLAQHNSEFTRRLSQLDIEVLKVKNNPHLKSEEKVKLISEKHRIIMQPIIFVFEQLYEITSAAPKTPHENNFQLKYLTYIESIINKLKNPLNPDKPQESWIPIKQLQNKLQQKANKRSSYILKMADISPVLANMKNTMISMPGVTANFNTRIIIRSVENNVAILPTKTKPKKLIFHGSDGKNYTYLFKGLEDLHLDERIMQFLSITNTMMERDKNNEKQPYKARHYSVIPLGPRSGLISWVDNVTPLFALYKRWQQREAAIATMKTNKSVIVLRPSELFYGKLNPLLQAAGITNIENRKEWPIATLKQVLEELMAETPKDLLSKELWCGSVTPSQWWQTVRRYSYSVAVMSIIGYIIGLGDRHLDNVLVDLTYGEVVHIDYNVCFEKGKSLRVPEKVPFRMTPNLEHALGVTGIEGIFRLTCEHVLKVMKRGRETLLTLLEAFIYDPLVEWGAGGGAAGAYTVVTTGAAGAANAASASSGSSKSRRRTLERACAKDMFAVRCAEIRFEWDENKTEMLAHLPKLIDILQKWLADHSVLSSSEARLQGCHQQMVVIKEVEAYGANLKNHPLYAISQRYMTYKQRKNAVDDSVKALVDTLADCKKRIEGHVVALDVINGPKLNRWIQDLSTAGEEDSAVFDVIKEFLTNAGQLNMITQCEQSEIELNQYKRQQNHFIRSCLELLTQYAAIVQYFPQSYLESHRSVLYSKWSTALLESKSPEIYHEVMTQLHGLLAQESANNPVVQQIAAFSYQLQTVYNDANAKLSNLFEKLQSEGGPLGVYEKNMSDAKNSLSNFALERPKALECVIITTLCNLNRRYLMLETGAQSAGDCLVDLTSRDGDWFLDEMSSISSLSIEFMSLKPTDQSSTDENLNCLKLANLIFKDLHDMSNNFQSVILPEAMKKIQAEDPSILLMINELNAIIFNTAYSLNELVKQLERQLQYLIMAMELPVSNIPMVIADLRMRYEAFLNGTLLNPMINSIAFPQNGIAADDSNADQQSSKQQSSGRMLLMGFNGLFQPLHVHSSDLAEAMAALNMPQAWKKIDQVCEAKDLAGLLPNDHLHSIVDDIFLVKRIQTMSEVFNSLVQMSCAFKGVGLPTVYDEDRLIKPVKRFMADYISRQFLGVHSLVLVQNVCCLLQKSGLNVTTEVEQKEIGASWKVNLEKLCEKAVENSLRTTTFNGNVIAQASTLINNFESAWRRRESYQRLTRLVAAQRLSVRSIRIRITAHTWLHEDALAFLPCNRAASRGSRNQAAPPVILHRQHFLAEMKKIVAALMDIQSKMDITLEKHSSLVASVEQRLKWAAGANPALQQTLQTFQQRSSATSTVGSLTSRVPTIIAVAGALLQHEIARTRTPEAVAADNEFTGAIVRWEKACSMAAQCSLTVTPIEESLMQLLHPEGAIDALWVQNVSALITDMIQQLQVDMTKNKEQLLTIEDTLKSSACKLSTLMETHNFLISDAKTLLKTLAKFPEQTSSAVPLYVEAHNVYLKNLSSVVEDLNEEKLSEDTVAICNTKSIMLFEKTEEVYNNLLALEKVVCNDDPLPRRSTLMRQNSVFENEMREPVGNGGRQQRNAHAASVWRRVRLKLEGRDSDLGPAKKNNQEQVDAIIKEAMSADNLCLLYEGWTPWV